jgi:uncharacterized protein
LNDILAELAKPGRDPREQFEAFSFTEGVKTIEDVRPGMRLPGIVTNITAFGVFVDIGVHQDGLVHISALSNRFVRNANEVVKVHQKVMVTVLDVDVERRRIALSMKDAPTPAPGTPKETAGSQRNPKSGSRKPSHKEQPEKQFSNSPFRELLNGD